MVRKPIISWGFGLRLLDNDYLVSKLIQLKEELANFNWDYMLVPDTDGSYHKVKDFDEIDRHYDWLTKAIPELEKMCKERGIDFEKEVQRKESQKRMQLATKLNDFYKDFDFYDYTDNVNGNEQDVIDDLVTQLSDLKAVNGILDALNNIKENGEPDEEQSQILNELIEEVKNVQSSLMVSLEDKLSKAHERSEEPESGTYQFSKDEFIKE